MSTIFFTLNLHTNDAGYTRKSSGATPATKSAILESELPEGLRDKHVDRKKPLSGAAKAYCGEIMCGAIC